MTQNYFNVSLLPIVQRQEEVSTWNEIKLTMDPNFPLARIPTQPYQSCEFCHRSTTPMWRRGPSGKGTLCNACGVKWSLNRRNRDQGNYQGQTLEEYHCKYCGETWPIHYFKNRQQFGAHCSNCSRRHRSQELNASPNVRTVPVDTMKVEKFPARSKAPFNRNIYEFDNKPTYSSWHNESLEQLLDAVEVVLNREKELTKTPKNNDQESD